MGNDLNLPGATLQPTVAKHAIGVKFPREWAPELLLDFARSIEGNGFDELWTVEDLAFHGGIAQCGAALAVTQHLTVGLAIAPAVVRNATYAAMEIATLGRMFPGRFHMGFGHGVESWIEQVGATPTSWLGSLREYTESIKQLITTAGPMSYHGKHVRMDNVHLEHPVAVPPLISLGVRQPKSMALAADVADGVIFAEVSGPKYVQHVRDTVGSTSRFTVLVYASEDTDELRRVLEWRLSLPRFQTQLAAYEGAMPADPLTEFAITGPQHTWREQAQQWFDAGADSVVYCPIVSDSPTAIADWSA
jgi:5,10-methylenetetrahydromethanopterin reductase